MAALFGLVLLADNKGCFPFPWELVCSSAAEAVLQYLLFGTGAALGKDRLRLSSWVCLGAFSPLANYLEL